MIRVTLTDPIEGNESPEEMVSEVYDRIWIEDGKIVGVRADRPDSNLVCRIEQRWQVETYELAVKGKVHAYTHIDIEDAD